MKLFKSLEEATEHLYLAEQQMQNALSEIIAEWDSTDHPDSFGMMMAREALEKGGENPLLVEQPEYREISNKRPTLEQMQKMVGGTVELITLADGRQVFCDEDGLSKELPINGRASVVVGDGLLSENKVETSKTFATEAHPRKEIYTDDTPF